ncbi:hypothetical protein K450DRAFT_276574 [Umbelopsis ramanniana AG]|uniref:Protein N-terminal glutamine amidohydrolase n=1 Tax=Umbelopsis ramanniana AG TaxID=1314678 RepID=A0AAD5EJM3_UMBRA|nr:uncharacterized protein K450DRAFT_276574 [Umbelopsis ramanniana AG]KAI8584201.1 hypothetical protein K450DRAFT_276574 [Umbelopsis ramanniana AG]
MFFPRSELAYTRCYCEENIYKLCEWIKEKHENEIDNILVVFISNPDRRVPLWEQSSAVEGNFVIWDYHVILLQCVGDGTDGIVYDFDSRLPFPTPFRDYISRTFRPNIDLASAFKRWFRLIPCRNFLRYFASDRSHMLQDGEYIMAPPTYKAICIPGVQMNLDRYIDMTQNGDSDKYGTILSEIEFFTYCRSDFSN